MTSTVERSTTEPVMPRRGTKPGELLRSRTVEA